VGEDGGGAVCVWGCVLYFSCERGEIGIWRVFVVLECGLWIW
jgi:hypothetical protein